MTIEITDEATAIGGTVRRIPASPRPPGDGRIRTRRDPAPAGNSTRVPRRRRERGAASQRAVRFQNVVEAVRVKPRAIVEIVGLLALLVVGIGATAASAAEHHQRVDRVAETSSQSRHDVGASATRSTRDETPRSGFGPSRSAPERVDLFGDSLGYQAEPYLDTFFAETHDYTVSSYTYGGTATCDWLNTMAAAAAQRPRDALFVFSGNAFTPCMDGVALRSPQYYDLYTAYTVRAIGIFSAVGAHVFLVGTPVDESSVGGWNQLDDLYWQLAQANPLVVTYVDAGASVETATGGFTWVLPCMRVEPTCGPDGSNVVRSPDGIHFCPDGTPTSRGVTGPCDEYSSGAFRFALAIVSAVTRYPNSSPFAAPTVFAAPTGFEPVSPP
jgi:hypothetical protein